MVSLNVYLVESYKLIFFFTQPRQLETVQPVCKLCVYLCVYVCVCKNNQMYLNIRPFVIATFGSSIFAVVIVQLFLKLSASFYEPYKNTDSISLH